MVWLIVIGLAILLGWLYFRYFKLYKIKNIIFVDGSLGTGKSYTSVALAVRLYKKQLRKYKLRKFIGRFLKWSKYRERFENLEEPLLYSNMRLRYVKHVPVTADLIQRKNYRFNYGSVLLLDEFSLMADQFTYKDRIVSERLSNFFKLWRHETKGGFIVINSQSTSDMHYSLKYVLSDYLYLHHKMKFPFFTAIKCQEMAYCGDKDGQQITNVSTGDVEDNLRTMLLLNKYYKYYDTYCYSVFTDELPTYHLWEFNGKDDDLKSRDLVSFKEYWFLKENLNRKVGDIPQKGVAENVEVVN